MSLIRSLGRAVRPAVLRALRGWRVGRLTLHLPDGAVHAFGDARAEPHADVFVDDDALFGRFVLQGDLGVGESYTAGEWHADDLTRFLALCLQNREHLALDTALTRALNLGNDLLHRRNANTRRGSRRNIQAHYDLSNDFFSLWLDETLTYSSAVFAHAGQPLADAQRGKYRTLAEKARLRGSDHVLEIGCGWGGFALFAAREYGCRVTGVTISERQFTLARQRVAEAGLADRIEIRLQDFRDLSGRFDKIVSIEMFEALGFENWGTFFATCDRVLAEDGIAVLQAISIPDHRFAEYRRHCDWLQKHIFPGSLLAAVGPMAGEMARTSRLGVFHLEDVGIHYAETLGRWRHRFGEVRPAVRRLGFDEPFLRTWEYYLAVCEAAFATRSLGNLQVVLTRPGNLALPGIPAAEAVAVPSRRVA